MDKRLLIIPVILVIGFAVMLSGALNFSNNDVPAEAEDIIIDEPETIFQSADINDSEVNETLLEEASSTPNMGGMGGMGGGLPAATPVTDVPSTDTDDGDENVTDEEPADSNETYTFLIEVV